MVGLDKNDGCYGRDRNKTMLILIPLRPMSFPVVTVQGVVIVISLWGVSFVVDLPFGVCNVPVIFQSVLVLML